MAALLTVLKNRSSSQHRYQQCKHKSFQYGFGCSFRGFMRRGSGRVKPNHTHPRTWPLIVCEVACHCLVGLYTCNLNPRFHLSQRQKKCWAWVLQLWKILFFSIKGVIKPHSWSELCKIVALKFYFFTISRQVSPGCKKIHNPRWHLKYSSCLQMSPL